MSRAQRALVCAVGICPVTISGLLLMLCGCRWQAWALETGTAILYLIWIVTAKE
jgi:hypothetical protein